MGNLKYCLKGGGEAGPPMYKVLSKKKTMNKTNIMLVLD